MIFIIFIILFISELYRGNNIDILLRDESVEFNRTIIEIYVYNFNVFFREVNIFFILIPKEYIFLYLFFSSPPRTITIL
jgi:hypothetical protein